MEASILTKPSADFASNFSVLGGTECPPMGEVESAHNYSGHFLCQSSDGDLCSCSDNMIENKDLCELLYNDEAIQAVVSDGLLCDESKPLFIYNDEAIEAGAEKTEDFMSDGLLSDESKALCRILSNGEAINPVAGKMEESISDGLFCNENKALCGTLHNDEAVNSVEVSISDDILCDENKELCEMLYNDVAINSVAGNGLFREEFSKRLAQKMAVDISDGHFKQLAREMEFSISDGLFCNEANGILAGDMEGDFSDCPLQNNGHKRIPGEMEVNVSFGVLHNEGLAGDTDGGVADPFLYNEGNARSAEEMEHDFFDSPPCNKGNGKQIDGVQENMRKVCTLEDEWCQHRKNFSAGLVEAVASQDDLPYRMSNEKLHRDTKWCNYNEANKKAAVIKVGPDNNNAQRKLNGNVKADILLHKAEKKLAKAGKANSLKDTLCQTPDTKLLSMCKRVTENNVIFKKHYSEVNKRIKKKLEIHVPENPLCNPAKKSLTCKESSDILYKQAGGSLLSLKQSIRNGACSMIFNAIEKRSAKKANVGLSEDISCEGVARKLEKRPEQTMKCKKLNNDGKKRLAKEMEPDNPEDILCKSLDKKVRRSPEWQMQNKFFCKKPHKEAKTVSLSKIENISNDPILKRLEGNPSRYQVQVIQSKTFVEKHKKYTKAYLLGEMEVGIPVNLCKRSNGGLRRCPERVVECEKPYNDAKKRPACTVAAATLTKKLKSADLELLRSSEVTINLKAERELSCSSQITNRSKSADQELSKSSKITSKLKSPHHELLRPVEIMSKGLSKQNAEQAIAQAKQKGPKEASASSTSSVRNDKLSKDLHQGFSRVSTTKLPKESQNGPTRVLNDASKKMKVIYHLLRFLRCAFVCFQEWLVLRLVTQSYNLQQVTT